MPEQPPRVPNNDPRVPKENIVQPRVNRPSKTADDANPESARSRRLRLRKERTQTVTTRPLTRMAVSKIRSITATSIPHEPAMTYNVPTPKSARPPGPALIEPDDDDIKMYHMVAERLCRDVAALNKSHTASTPTSYEANAVVDVNTGAVYEYRHLSKGPDAHIWIRSLANDLGRLAQGVGTRMPSGTNTVFYIHPSKIPKHKKVGC